MSGFFLKKYRGRKEIELAVPFTQTQSRTTQDAAFPSEPYDGRSGRPTIGVYVLGLPSATMRFARGDVPNHRA